MLSMAFSLIVLLGICLLFKDKIIAFFGHRNTAMAELAVKETAEGVLQGALTAGHELKKATALDDELEKLVQAKIKEYQKSK